MWKNTRVSFLFILSISLVVRIIFLERIPSGVTNDEMDYILSAKSIYLSGSDISHTWNPFTFTIPKSGNFQAEIVPLITFWLIGPLPLSILTSKLVYAFFGVGTVGLLYAITKKLIGNKEAFFVGLVAACNPWLIFFARTAYDTPVAIFFYLLALYLLLTLKQWNILLAFPAFFIAFFSYAGTKLILIPFSFISIYFAWHINKKYLRQYLLLFSLCIVVLVYFLISTRTSSSTRIAELASPHMQSISSSVDIERRLSIHTPLTNILSNRYVAFGKYSLEKYLNAFSPNFLFLHGDGKDQFTLWQHGVFYYIDIVFILLGFWVLRLKHIKIFYLLTSIAIIAPLPSVLSVVGISYAIRSMLLAPVFIIFIGVGISYCVSKYKYALYIVGSVYFVLLLNFTNMYFFRNPINNSESFNFSGRLLSKYLSFQKNTVYVLDESPRSPYEQYLFYSNTLNNLSKNKVANDFVNKSFTIHSFHFTSCPKLPSWAPGDVIIYKDCLQIPTEADDLYIAQLSDSGKIYTIHHDQTCAKYDLGYYPENITFSELDVESLSEQHFCETFITRKKYN